MKEPLKSLKPKIIKALKSYNPLKIYVYGSYARGEAGPDSDLDLLIIKNTRKRERERRIEVMRHIYSRENLERPLFNIPIAPVVYTDNEIKSRLSWDPFIKSVFHDKVLIYEKDS